jgi:methylenetetrahydrofolate dehydrogenase (NADP+)/methenyltetrahydrofolate cyclohydrolase
MNARLLDGTALAATIRARLADRVGRLASTGRKPGLAVLLVGDDPASEIYVRNKIKACQAVGVESRLQRLPASASQYEVQAVVAAFNADPAIDGILVQMPLPRQIDPVRVIEAIAIEKDVDGYHTLSAGALVTGRIDTEPIGFNPCTPFGVMRMLASGEVPIAGARAVVIGRSNTVGKPMALMLLAADSTVTICHSATRDLAAIVREADIVVAAVGRAHTVSADMVKPGAAVVDVGMNRDADGKLVGDVDFASVREVAGWISPVPGGVGPMTIAMLLENTVLSAERSAAVPRARHA